MPTQVVLLRGIKLGPTNRVASAEPTDALADLVRDLAAIVARNPLADVATDDRRYQVPAGAGPEQR